MYIYSLRTRCQMLTELRYDWRFFYLQIHRGKTASPVLHEKYTLEELW